MKRSGMTNTLRCLVRRFWYPCLCIGIGVVAGHVPSEADGAALATVPHSGWMILSMCMISYGAGVLVGGCTANTKGDRT